MFIETRLVPHKSKQQQAEKISSDLFYCKWAFPYPHLTEMKIAFTKVNTAFILAVTQQDR